MPAGSVGNNNVEPGELLELYWNYYALHAEQRMKILELFIAIETVLFGVVASEFTGGNFSDRIIGLAVSIVALLCFWLDKRTTNLLHQCRVAMRALENDYMSGYLAETVKHKLKDYHFIFCMTCQINNPERKFISIPDCFIFAVQIPRIRATWKMRVYVSS